MVSPSTSDKTMKSSEMTPVKITATHHTLGHSWFHDASFTHQKTMWLSRRGAVGWW